MTMYYSKADVEFMKAQSEALSEALARAHGEQVAPLDDVPDMGDAERIWKLLVDAAQS